MRIKGALFADKEVAGSLLVVNLDLLGTVKHLLILFVAHEKVLKELLIQVLCRARLLYKEEARMGHCLWWR